MISRLKKTCWSSQKKYGSNLETYHPVHGFSSDMTRGITLNYPIFRRFQYFNLLENVALISKICRKHPKDLPRPSQKWYASKKGLKDTGPSRDGWFPPLTIWDIPWYTLFSYTWDVLTCVLCMCVYIYCIYIYHYIYMVVSINGGTHKWMVYDGKSH